MIHQANIISQCPECFGWFILSSILVRSVLNQCNQAIEVPETLLKKRKQNEKAREERLAAAAAARKVSCRHQPMFYFHDVYDLFEEWPAEFSSAMLPSINHLSGLNSFIKAFCTSRSATELELMLSIC